MEKAPVKTDAQLSETEVSCPSESENAAPREYSLTEAVGGGRDSDSPAVSLEVQERETILTIYSDLNCEESYDALSFDNANWSEDSPEVVEDEPQTEIRPNRFIIAVR
ncbi:unnamed protein product [Phytophthora fragariaefolia]|uniref:Unnamed protein product n=1 Tax=Phytophthora fragariaefolia TaxID=1490495 RepID=A0A9W6TTD8_9STRA|nr:unnamed protein product [Phytophthora fragariaefolia]